MIGEELTLNEIREIQLDILTSIHNLCEKFGIRYSLGGGTLLGAVRHHGYIPWDDDIDIMMPRPDYEHFLKTYSAIGEYEVQDIYNDDTYFYPFAKIYDKRTLLQELVMRSGVYVDVFPIDGLPSKEMSEMYHERLTKIVYKELYYSAKTYKIREGNKALLFLKYLLKRCKSPSRKKAVRHLERLVHSYDFNTAEYAGAICGRYGVKEHMPSGVFLHYTELPFEGRSYSVIKDYDGYLRAHYGDYMVLPPVEQRISNHINKVYWK
ncbi:MAG: LicD family protein [Prevotella sp.]|jgi:lipopolysaccharide cholinephosphotransferase|nr:LicD family protein [Prevotella sp.]